MNFWQIINLIQTTLRAAVWSGSSTLVFASESVVVCGGESDINALDANLVLPMAVIVPGGGTVDPQANDEAGYWLRDLTVILATRNSNDRLGSAAIMGANRVGSTDSRGRGVLELEAPVLAAIEFLNVNEGLTIQLKAQSGFTTRMDANDRIYALQEYTFEVTCTSSLL